MELLEKDLIISAMVSSKYVRSISLSKLEKGSGDDINLNIIRMGQDCSKYCETTLFSDSEVSMLTPPMR